MQFGRKPVYRYPMNPPDDQQVMDCAVGEPVADDIRSGKDGQERRDRHEDDIEDEPESVATSPAGIPSGRS